MKNTLLVLMGTLLMAGQILSAQGNPYNADYVVAQDGSGDFSTLQAAIDAVPSNEVTNTVIYIKRGTYDTEKLIIPADKINITMIGESKEETVISYHIYDCPDGKCPVEDAALWTGDNISTSATLTILGDGFRAENLTIENSAGPVGQALAITVKADKVVFINCNFSSYQDTLYFWDAGNRVYFEDCLVIGRTDYIYGAAIVFFQSCEIRSWGGGWITAPSTPQDQPYGFVFYECDITYALNSPRAGDDGATVALGRPWHNYPKVAWLFCDMTEKLNPLGWNTKWNMDYADTSPDLHLYEYGNTGPGADMSGRANWVGLRELNPGEDTNYTAQKVLAGTDGWDPSAGAPTVTVYNWTDGGTTGGWMVKENWDPVDTPMLGEIANVEGYTITADGGNFQADLNLMDGASLDLTVSSSVIYLTAGNSGISTVQDVSLDGKIKTRDSLSLDISGNLALNAKIIGIHEILKSGTGSVTLTSDNSGYSGHWIIQAGSLSASVENSLGVAGVSISSTGKIIIGNDNAFYPKAALAVVSGASLELNASIVLSEFFIDGERQDLGVYDSGTNPGLITGAGTLTVGRPSSFTFIGGENGNWDNPVHFIPALMPEAGELVYSDREMETTSTVFPADVYFESGGGIRMRGTHRATGELHFNEGTAIKYNTGGNGFSLEAPIFADGDLELLMESGSGSGSTMRLPGPISGTGVITVLNNGKDINYINHGTVLVSGDNSGYSGTWDITADNRRFPGEPYVSILDAAGPNSLGRGRVLVGLINRLALSHTRCAGDELQVNLSGSGMITLNTDVVVKKFYLDNSRQPDAVYSAGTDPSVFEGSGSLIADSTLTLPAAPSALTATEVLEIQATVEWTENADNAMGQVITLDGIPVDTIQPGSAAATITELLPETVYAIGVFAYNLLGNSDTVTTSITTAEAVGVDSRPARQIFLSPNPANSMVYIHGTEVQSWKLFNLSGQLLRTGQSSELEITGLGPGNYILNVSSADGLVNCLSFMKK